MNANIQIEIYSDGSVNPKLKVGVGAIAIISHELSLIAEKPTDLPLHFKLPIALRTYHDVTCAKLEIIAVLWALKEFESQKNTSSLKNTRPLTPLIIYTDSKTVAELPGRRAKLEKNEFNSRRTGERLSNGELYIEFFEIWDRISYCFDVKIQWLKGHTPKSERSRIQLNFAEIDQAARAELRKVLST